MSRPDLDGIIRSPSAETFLRMVTKGFYDNSYTGLWMYEVIGREWDEMRKWAEGLKDEINPQTCTWSIGIWEWVYGIKTDKTLQLEYRRQRILAKILGTKPVNPEVIRRGVARITGCDVDITDFAGPYRFALKIHMQEDGDTLPYGLVREYIRIVKPSHLAAFLAWVFLAVIDSTQLEQFLHPWVRMHWCIPFWGCDILNGARFLDGSVLLNSRRGYDLVPGIKNGIRFYAKEAIDASCINIREKVYIEEKTGVVVAVKASVNFLEGCHQTAYSAGTVTKTRHMAVVKTTGTIENITITYKRNLHYLDGSELLDGSRLVNAFYGKESI